MTCSVVLIHGTGTQRPGWSEPFQSALTAALGADSALVTIHETFWADDSKLKDLITGLRDVPLDAPANPREAAALRAAHDDFFAMLTADASAEPPPAPIDTADAQFGPRDLVRFARHLLDEGANGLATDVANYMVRNDVRVRIQYRLHDMLGRAGAGATAADHPTVLVAHSQGTIIAYDVLREAGINYPGLKTWVTMGCPLGKYAKCGWGRHQWGVAPDLRWLNLYDPHDFVGKTLADVVDWPRPRPDDVSVDNVRYGGHSHAHWQNPQVARAVAAEVRAVLH